MSNFLTKLLVDVEPFVPSAVRAPKRTVKSLDLLKTTMNEHGRNNRKAHARVANLDKLPLAQVHEISPLIVIVEASASGPSVSCASETFPEGI